MFKRILRSKTVQARVRWILAIVMVPPFAFFFHLWTGARATPGPGGSAGLLFGRQVPWETFEQEYASLRRSTEARFGTLPEALIPSLRQQTWDRLILKTEARRRMKVSDEEVARYIQRQPAFQQQGRFVPDLYFRFARGSGLTPQAFEERVRDDLRIEQLLDAVKAQVTLSDEEIRTAYAKERERMRALMLLIEPSSFEPQVTQGLTEAALRDFYATHQEAVRLAPTRIIESLGMPSSNASDKTAALSKEDLTAYYDEHQEQFTQEDGSLKPLEEVRDTIEQDLKAQRTRKRLTDLALDLQDDVDNGLRFVEIALTRGLLAHRVGPLDESAASDIPNGPTSAMVRKTFEVPVGTMTRVFNSPVGVFLLMPIEELPSRVPPFEEVRETVKRLAVQERSREAAKARAGELHGSLLAKHKDGFTVEEAAFLLGIRPWRPAPFTRQGPIERLGSVPAVAEVLLTLKAGEVSEPLETPQGFVIGFVEERLPVEETQFAKDNEVFRQTLLDSRRQEHATRWLESLRANAHLKSFLEETPK